MLLCHRSGAVVVQGEPSVVSNETSGREGDDHSLVQVTPCPKVFWEAYHGADERHVLSLYTANSSKVRPAHAFAFPGTCGC